MWMAMRAAMARRTRWWSGFGGAGSAAHSVRGDPRPRVVARTSSSPTRSPSPNSWASSAPRAVCTACRVARALLRAALTTHLQSCPHTSPRTWPRHSQSTTRTSPPTGCLSSPHHFLSPRTVEQLNAEGGLTSAELQVAESGEEAAAAASRAASRSGVATGTHTRSLPNLHGPSLLSAGSRRKLPPVSAPPSYRQGGHPVFKGAAAAAAAAAAVAAASAAASPRPSSASSKGEGKLLPPGVASASSSLSSGARSAADLAASVYEAIGGLATLAAAAPPAAQSRRGEKRARLDPYRATSTGEVDEGYEGAGISERRKPAGLGNLRLPTTNSCAPPAGTVTVRPLPHSAGAQPSSSSSDHSSGQHSHLSLASSSALGTSADPTPASARSVTDIAALVSPAIAGLGGYSALGLQSGLHSGRLHAQPGAGGGGGGGSSSLAPSPGKIAAMSPKGFGASAVSPGKQQHIGSGGIVSSPNTGAPPRIVDLVAC